MRTLYIVFEFAHRIDTRDSYFVHKGSLLSMFLPVHGCNAFFVTLIMAAVWEEKGKGSDCCMMKLNEHGPGHNSAS
jgi:hypothetical protein